jgi:hypothetical protein
LSSLSPPWGGPKRQAPAHSIPWNLRGHYLGWLSKLWHSSPLPWTLSKRWPCGSSLQLGEDSPQTDRCSKKPPL